MKKIILTILGTLAIAIPATMFTLAYISVSKQMSTLYTTMNQTDAYIVNSVNQIIQLNNLKVPTQQSANQ